MIAPAQDGEGFLDCREPMEWRNAPAAQRFSSTRSLPIVMRNVRAWVGIRWIASKPTEITYVKPILILNPRKPEVG
jgi:hypothetical protein